MSEMNPLLAKLKLPGRVFQLPSAGALYQDGVFDESVQNGEIQVHPMSAMDEINLKNPDLLFNGQALEKVLAECVPSIKKPLELFARDVDAILFFLRISTYGPNFQVDVKHTCKEAKSHSYVVNVENQVMNMKRLDPTMITVMNKVQIGDQAVVTRPLKYVDLVKIFTLSGMKKDSLNEDDLKQIAVVNILSMIDNVDGVSDQKFIEGWVRRLTTPQINRIIESSKVLNDWGPSPNVTLKCKDCGEDMMVELPLNPVSFFTE
jgi:hypothetical protein